MKNEPMSLRLLVVAGLGIANMGTALAQTEPGKSGGEIVRAVVGFEQIGSSGNPSNQDFSFDFFISRPVGGTRAANRPEDEIWGKRLRWWGDVRIAGVPYTQNTSLAKLASQFTTAFGEQSVSKLAQSIEFQTGPEIRIAGTDPRSSLTDPTSRARFGLMWFAGAGATGPNNPTDNITVYQSPVVGSSQATTLSQVTGLPTCSGTGCPTPPTAMTLPLNQPSRVIPLCPASGTCMNYIALLPQTGNRFLQQWGTGLRLYTVFADAQSNPLGTAPATVEFSLGQNAAVTEGHLSHFVAHAAATYPFSIGPRKADSVVIYLFGEVTAALARPRYQDTVTLNPALDSNSTPISVSNPLVTQIPVAANRQDIYRVGVGIDLVSVWKKLTAPAPAAPAAPAPAPAAAPAPTPAAAPAPAPAAAPAN
jgi:hypothetical protein